MANDATNKPTSNPNENTTFANPTDQQKVPPLRIVLNSASNQKSSSTAVTALVGPQQTNTKKDKSQDAKSEGTVKVGGRVRIKLGTNKQQSSGKNNGTNETSAKSIGEGASNKFKNQVDKLVENINEDSTSSFGHLRRITRRSQRAVQPISNEDEESISSMTSTDENQNTNNNQIIGDSINTQDSEQSNSATLTSASANAAGSSATNGSSNTETPRRYKRRKVENSESQSIDCDNLLGAQNYRLPSQNSFELFKNIRQQVDKKLKNLNIVSPRLPHGFREYMLTSRAYLLDGNRLGNGFNLFVNEDGGLNLAPMGKYRVLRHNRINYSVPNRARVPLDLPVNSPLYDLFVEQEKERYRMRFQHIKEREKLTLSVEQEIMRVYNQAALAASEQIEPFSACTMLKHQEIYNYMDSDGVTILCKEDAQQDQVQPDGVRTRRRQQGHISPSPPTRKSSDLDEANIQETIRKEDENSTSPNNQKDIDDSHKTVSNERVIIDEKEQATEEDEKEKHSTISDTDQVKSLTTQESSKTGNVSEQSGISPISPPEISEKSQTEDDETNGVKPDDTHLTADKSSTSSKLDIKTEAVSPAQDLCPVDDANSNSSKFDAGSTGSKEVKPKISSEIVEDSTISNNLHETNASEEQIVMETEETSNVQPAVDAESLPSAEEKQLQNREFFMTQLQDIDDKWDKIRHEMLVRHKNEAESLHAIQKLEWEWKTKEIGVCDVRTTLVIDNTLVPRLDIYSQDY